MPVGLGQPLYDKLDADIAYAMMGLNAVKGVEIGAGFASVTRPWQHARRLADSPDGLRGQQGRWRARWHQHRAGPGRKHRHQAHQLHPDRRAIPSTWRAAPTEVITKGRHDPCVGIRAAPIMPKRMLALVVMDHALRHRAQCGDVHPPVSPITASFL
jgi:chorismate synthase